jgi:hypothetical protein
MDLFISIHCVEFNKSNWCQQEIGFALAYKTMNIPLMEKHEIKPQGFLGEIQAMKFEEPEKTTKKLLILSKIMINTLY